MDVAEKVARFKSEIALSYYAVEVAAESLKYPVVIESNFRSTVKIANEYDLSCQRRRIDAWLAEKGFVLVRRADVF